MKMKKVLFAIALALGITASAQRKVGHVNIEVVIQAMPETKAAEGQLEIYAEQLNKDLQDMYVEYQSRLKTFQDAEPGMTKLNRDSKVKELQELQQRIQEYEQNMAVDYQGKQSELLKPIIDKVQAAIDEVTKAQKMEYVIDSSESKRILLSVNGGNDLTPLVKTKLGIQ